MRTIIAAAAVTVALADPAHAQDAHGAIAFRKSAGGKDAA